MSHRGQQKKTKQHREVMRKAAEERQSEYDTLTTQQKLDRHNTVAPPPQGERQRQRLLAQLNGTAPMNKPRALPRREPQEALDMGDAAVGAKGVLEAMSKEQRRELVASAATVSENSGDGTLTPVASTPIEEAHPKAKDRRSQERRS